MTHFIFIQPHLVFADFKALLNCPALTSYSYKSLKRRVCWTKNNEVSELAVFQATAHE